MHHAPASRRQILKTFAAALPIGSALGQALRALGAHAPDDALPPCRAITRGPRFHWRGYYDKLLFDPTNRYVLCNEVAFEGRSPTADDVIRVGMIDTDEGDRWVELGTARAWNWQQGCMLQWIPGSRSEIAWNDREDDRFVSRILDVATGKSRTLPHPFYCLSPDGAWGFAPDFRRLNDTRLGYGYTGLPDPNRDVLAPADTGLWRIDMRTGDRRLILSLADAAAIPFTGPTDAGFRPTSKHWFNHLLCNTDGTRLFFLHRWHAPEEKSGFHTRAFTVGPDGRDLHIMDPHGRTSHFVWRDAEHVMAWAWHPSHGDRFYLYRDRTDRVEAVGPDAMTANGHNTYVPGTDNRWILNDTYPSRDARRAQSPYLYHIPTDRRVPLGHFESPAAYRGEWRCDTHPCASRDGRWVSFDSPHAGGRQVYLIDIGGIIG